MLTMHLDRAEIAESRHCSLARVEIRPEGWEQWSTYLEERDVGWLSRDESPRRSPAYALP